MVVAVGFACGTRALAASSRGLVENKSRRGGWGSVWLRVWWARLLRGGCRVWMNGNIQSGRRGGDS